MRSIVILIMFGCTMLAFGEVRQQTTAQSATVQKAKLGDKAAPLDGLTYIKGAPVTFEAGKVYVVEFWATWCGPCIRSIPHLTELQNKFKDKGVTIIGIASEPVEKIQAFVKGMGAKMDYTVAVDSERKAWNGYMKPFMKTGIPAAFIIDRDGLIAWAGHPMAMDEDLPEIVESGFNINAYLKAKAEKDAAKLAQKKLYSDYFIELRRGGSIEKVRPIAEKLIEAGDAIILNTMAMVIMTDTPKKHRDLGIALKAAKVANANSGGNNPSIMDTYAQALFVNGRINEAITLEKEALSLSGNDLFVKDALEANLRRFKTAAAE